MQKLINQVEPEVLYRNYGPPDSPSDIDSWMEAPPPCTGLDLSLDNSPSSSPILFNYPADEVSEAQPTPPLFEM